MNSAASLRPWPNMREQGNEYVFGVPGEENADFVMSLEQSRSIRFVPIDYRENQLLTRKLGELTCSI